MKLLPPINRLFPVPPVSVMTVSCFGFMVIFLLGMGTSHAQEEPDEQLVHHTVSGLVELENYMSTNPHQEFKDIFKKNELRAKVNYRFGTDTIYFETTANAYVQLSALAGGADRPYRYADNDFELGRNLRMSGTWYELNFNQLYLNYSHEWFRIRVGNQIYAWGTADALNPTSYFNSFDLRELFFRGDDELRQGVPSLSALATINNSSIELVFVPLQVPVLLAERGDFWGIHYRAGPFPVNVSQPDGMPFKARTMAIGIKYYLNVLETDIQLSYFYGPDKEPDMRPLRTIAVPYKPVHLVVQSYYETLHMLGIALSKTFWKFAFQFEAAYSPNKTGVVSQYSTRNLSLPFAVKESHYLTYSVGFNFFIPIEKLFENHEGELVFTAEWHQSVYFDRSLMDPLITDLLTLRLQDTFLNNKLEISFTTILDVRYPDYIIWPKVSYKFENGIYLALSYIIIDGRRSSTPQTGDIIETGSFLGYFLNNDLVALKVGYEY